MAATGEQISGHGVFDAVATLFQQGHIPGQGGRIAGNIDDAPGCKPVERFDGIGIQALSGRVHHHNICLGALLFQLQRRLACVAAEKFRVFDAVALGVVPGILHCRFDHLYADHLPCGFCHSQGDGSYAAVQNPTEGTILTVMRESVEKTLRNRKEDNTVDISDSFSSMLGKKLVGLKYKSASEAEMIFEDGAKFIFVNDSETAGNDNITANIIAVEG